MEFGDIFRAVDWAEGARQIEDCEYLFVRQIGETEELTLELTVVEAKAQAPITTPKDDSVLERLKVGGRPIKPDSSCRLFRLIFDRQHMVAYTVSNESYSKFPEPSEKFVGKLFRLFSRSHLLDFVKRTNHASDKHPGKLCHYQVACQNHIIDVITTAPPAISVSSAHQYAARSLAALGGTQPDLKDIPRRRSAI